MLPAAACAALLAAAARGDACPGSSRGLLDALGHGFWDDGAWVPAGGLAAAPLPLRSLLSCASQRPRWVHVVGDSSTRFFYSALLTLFNVSRAHPHHFMPDGDECSRRAAGLVQVVIVLVMVLQCGHDHRAGGWRLTFEWWHHGLTFAKEGRTLALPRLARDASTTPDVV
eukprot:gene44288-10164_t